MSAEDAKTESLVLPMGTAACYVVSYDHGGLVLWGYDHFVRHLRELIAWLERHPKLKMGLDNEAWMYDWLAENQPAVLAELRRSLTRSAGRLGVASCTYGQPLGNYLLEESNIRQIAQGIATTRERLGYDISIYSFSEHAAFPQMPQILAGLGLRGALMRTHYLMYGFCPGYDVPIAWWAAPDGSHIACVPTYIHQERQVPGHQAHPPGPYGLTTEDTWILTRYPSAESPASLDTFRERFAHIRPLLATRIDDSGLKREALVTELDTRDEYRWATLEDVFDQFPEPAATISPTAEDFGTRMPWGYRGNELFDLARRAEILVLTAERLAARIAAGLRPCPSGDGTEADLRQAWKDLLVGQHHDIQIVARAGTLGRERLLASLARTQMLIRTLLSSLSDGGLPEEAGSFVAFNPLPWPRTEPSLELPDGTVIPGPVTVPALGWAGSASSDDSEMLTDLSFETDAYRVQFSPEGGLAALNGRDGTPLLRGERKSGQLAGVIDGEARLSSGSVRVTRSAAGYHVHEPGMIGPLPYTATWLFPAQGSRIDYRLMVRFDGERIGEPTSQKNDSRSCFLHEQKLRVRFFPGVDAESAVGVYDVPFGVATTQRSYIEGNYWTALADDQGGLAIANRGTMGSVREEDGAFSVPLAFSTNYVWGSEVICGERQWALGLLPFTGPWQDASLHRKALEFAFPVVAVPGSVPQPPPDFLRLDNPNVHLTAFYQDGGHGYVRVFNGTAREQVFTLEGWDGEWEAVDLLHRDLGADASSSRLRPWGILTLRLW